ncbi:unknown protein [Microcystis aeruginosa NIES-843]|uniref:Uncharacterized protein n=1 Tax=Microcystis aeruginosa (strain NIES-843 / IAM M-2473) TaxID=449447 RepID=B0JMN2_MICAN|nr:unknown protein [Microcystis aeruginosa NIES-843]
MHLIFVNLPIGIFTGKLSFKIGHYFRFYHSIQAFGGFYPPNPPLGAWRRPQTPRALAFRWDAYTRLFIFLYQFKSH